MSTRRTWPGTPSLLSELVDERLTDAACVSLAPGFDDLLVGESPQDADERFATATAVCARCPVRSACEAAADELGDLAVGVWAGRVHHPPGTRGRPRKDSTDDR